MRYVIKPYAKLETAIKKDEEVKAIFIARFAPVYRSGSDFKSKQPSGN